MATGRQHIKVFEHQSIFLNQKFEDDVVFDSDKFDSLVKFFGKGVPYYSLIRNGIRFNEFVGALQVGNLLISVLPKADKYQQESTDEKDKWNSILVDMLRVVHGFEVKAPSTSHMKVKNNTVLDLYFEIFVSEVEALLHRGLAKKYRQTEGNLNALKGSIQFSKQISKNSIHKERFYTRHTTYDVEHLLHIILYRTLLLLKRINTNTALIGRINALTLNFPEMPDRKITEADFDKIVLNRKTQDYQKALEIARLILLHYHPDLTKGREDVLALMFDMNLLWEKFVLASLKKDSGLKARGQDSKSFWQPDTGYKRNIRPDITIEIGEEKYVIDTKWKLVSTEPSMDDLRQMYAYHHYFGADKVALLYPGKNPYFKGTFVPLDKEEEKDKVVECGLLFSKAETSVKNWQNSIREMVNTWAK
ncbi:5-methylcytosine-specific restriction enzyme subunit McrC [Algoriphagus boseongensis]|uniref:5-methylcytosine-specific restriction enzyme subunit McrC n=1 Tax=Algoriphagus boseongensis TaxID=1442587 RepID=A0A4R6TAF9_9BACT|nr:restriction endonuclease [Algoriphagus boseongensis]TDQ18605.1 5-methylcytosine-specific restriction enzyme subunit McrC [Algoriphagus boseongensis]